MKRLSIETLITHFSSHNEVGVKSLSMFIKSQIPDISDSTVSWYIHHLYKTKIIMRIGRGKYVLGEKRIFMPEIHKKLQQLYQKIRKEFPNIKFCISDSNWLNSFSNLQQINKQIIIEVEKEVSESVFLKLQITEMNIFLNPNAQIVDLYIASASNAIIIKNLPSQSPLCEHDGITTPSLEKILVDCLIDKSVYSVWSDEVFTIFRNAFTYFNINFSRLKRYAKRRNRLSVIEEIVNQISTNNIKL